jgi:Response regulator containing CheY-like receiver, AAA-type ATPase, and DNA-binding domains
MARILVVDDEPVIRVVLRRLLEPYGHEVILGEDGLRGVGMAQHQRPDAIVLDLMMPMMDGHAALQMLAEGERTREIPVIVLTAMARAAEHDRCIAEGAYGVLTKPFDPEALAAMIERAIEERHPLADATSATP